MGQVGGGGVQTAAVARELLGGDGQQVPGRAVLRIGPAAEGVEVDHRPPPQAPAEILPLADVAAQLPRRLAALQEPVQQQPHFLGAAAGGALDVALVAQEQGGIFRKVVQRRGHFRVDQGHVAVGGGAAQAVFVFLQIPGQGGDQRLVGVPAPLLPGDEAGQIPAQPGHAAGMKPRQGLPHGQDHRGGAVFLPALGAGVKIAHGVQLVAEEFRPQGHFGGGGEDVHNAAPDGELTAALHHVAAAVAGGDQPGSELLQGVLPAHLQGEGGPQQHRRGQGAQAQGFPGEDLQPGLARGQVVQLPQALLLPGPGGGRGVVEGQLPAGQDGKFLPQEAFQLLLKPAGGHVVLADGGQRAARVPVQPRDQVAAVDLADAGDGGAFPLGNGLGQGGVFREGLQGREQGFHRMYLDFRLNSKTTQQRGKGRRHPFPWRFDNIFPAGRVRPCPGR